MSTVPPGANTPPAAVHLGHLIGRVLRALLRATPPGRWLEHEFLAPGHVRPAEKNGYRFWGPVVAAILVTEVLGALADWLHRRTLLEVKWPTISSTVGHLETLSPILAALVVGAIAMIAFDAVTAAEKQVGGNLSLRSATRGEFGGEDAWIVSFEPATGFGSGCVVAVRKGSAGTTATPSPGCRG